MAYFRSLFLSIGYVSFARILCLKSILFSFARILCLFFTHSRSLLSMNVAASNLPTDSWQRMRASRRSKRRRRRSSITSPACLHSRTPESSRCRLQVCKKNGGNVSSHRNEIIKKISNKDYYKENIRIINHYIQRGLLDRESSLANRYARFVDMLTHSIRLFFFTHARCRNACNLQHPSRRSSRNRSEGGGHPSCP